jgi:hypothetical protein
MHSTGLHRVLDVLFLCKRMSATENETGDIIIQDWPPTLATRCTKAILR